MVEVRSTMAGVWADGTWRLTLNSPGSLPCTSRATYEVQMIGFVWAFITLPGWTAHRHAAPDHAAHADSRRLRGHRRQPDRSVSAGGPGGWRIIEHRSGSLGRRPTRRACCGRRHGSSCPPSRRRVEDAAGGGLRWRFWNSVYGPLATVQDLGRPGRMMQCRPAARWIAGALQVANALVGNDLGARGRITLRLLCRGAAARAGGGRGRLGADGR